MSTRKISEYHYDLPENKIAKAPVEPRDRSRLLIYEQSQIRDQRFTDLPHQLPANSCLVFNNTKVIPARLYFKRESGADIEVFLLKPVAPFANATDIMSVKGTCTWQCMVGNKKKWRAGEIVNLNHDQVNVKAQWHQREEDLISFQYDENLNFAAILDLAGNMPIPPYFNRKASELDKNWYQTVYSKNEGAVAAPTAGLHFTNDILGRLAQNGNQMVELTLHVSSGTFQPVKTEDYTEHPMHREEVCMPIEAIEKIANSSGPVIPVGTTSMRSLESTYWFGVEWMQNPNSKFDIKKDSPYKQQGILPDFREVYGWMTSQMKKHNLQVLQGQTQIFIYPGYDFKVCDAIITNFHQPGSTLLLLIAAFIGEDWKKVYNHALENEYRFLSYGDSSLLFKSKIEQ